MYLLCQSHVMHAPIIYLEYNENLENKCMENDSIVNRWSDDKYALFFVVNRALNFFVRFYLDIPIKVHTYRHYFSRQFNFIEKV